MKYLLIIIVSALMTFTTMANQISFPTFESCHVNTKNEVIILDHATGLFSKPEKKHMVYTTQSTKHEDIGPMEFFLPSWASNSMIPSKYLKIKTFFYGSPGSQYNLEFANNTKAREFKSLVESIESTIIYLFHCDKKSNPKGYVTILAIPYHSAITIFETRLQMQHETW